MLLWRRWTSIGLVLIAIFLIVGCRRQPVELGLPGTDWTLQMLSGKTLIVGSQITVEFSTLDDGLLITGVAGCNEYQGTYTYENHRITISDLVATDMFCAEPAGLIEQEQTYFAALHDINRYEIAEDVLTIYDERDEAILIYTLGAHEPSE